MFKIFLLFSSVILFVNAPTPGPTLTAGRMLQEATPVSAAPDVTNPVKSTPATRERAKKLYEVDCLMCHGANGDGKTDLAKDMQLTLPDWTDPAVLASVPDQTLFNAIRNGKDKMPAEAEGRASNNDVWDLIHYIRGMSRGHAAKPSN
jgi:cytochrome c